MAKEVHKYGTEDGWHGVIEVGGQFPPEKDRYHLYIGMCSLFFCHTIFTIIFRLYHFYGGYTLYTSD